MDESYKCECLENVFWYFKSYVRCISCYNEYKYNRETGELWMRRFNHEAHFYKNWEHTPKGYMGGEK